MAVSGGVYSCPRTSVTVSRWLAPIPSSMRPPDSSWTVAAPARIATASRPWMIEIPTPSPIRSVRPPIAASSANGSRPADSCVQNAS